MGRTHRQEYRLIKGVTFPFNDFVGDANKGPEGCRQQEQRYQEMEFTPADLEKALP
jgi:hypothetical protein